VTTEDGQVTMIEGADVLLAGEGGVVLGGRVAQVTGGRVVIDLDGAGHPEDTGPEEYSAAERLAMIGWIVTAPAAFAAAALVRDMPVLAARIAADGAGWIGRRVRKAAHADWGPGDATERW